LTTIGAAILATAGESLKTCLESLYGQVDEVYVFTWDKDQTATAKQYQATVVTVPPVEYVELIRQQMQLTLPTDWILILDPDEVVEPNAPAFFRQKIRTARDDIVGFWIPYRMLFLGEELTHSFPNVKQLRLFRRDRVIYTKGIHLTPTPLDGRFEYLDDSDPGIQHNFVTNLQQRFARHLQWSRIEARELYESGVEITDAADILKAGLEEFKKYAVDNRGLHDGCKGLINALMHGWKNIVTLCLLWELQNSKNFSIEPFEEWETFFANLDLPKQSIQ
jgi:hypothetical protein